MITADVTSKELVRFWAKVEKGGPDECWTWTGATTGSGTPAVCLRGKNYTAMRLVWELEHGESAPVGRSLVRLCETLGCVNPAHWKIRGDDIPSGELVPGSRLCAATEEMLRRFWARVDKRGPDECWTWTSTCSPAPVLKWGHKRVSALHVMYELDRGEALPAGVQLRRTCGKVRCINPAHLKIRGEILRSAQNDGPGRPTIFYLAGLAGFDLAPLSNGGYRVVRT